MKDPITSLQFTESGGLYVTSFTGQISLYSKLARDCQPELIKQETGQFIYDSCIEPNESHSLLVGTSDGSIFRLRPRDYKPEPCLFEHTSGVQCLRSNSTHRLIISGSWDRSSWIVPCDSNGVGADAKKISLAGKVQVMDTADNYVVYGLSTGENIIYDLRHTDVPLKNESYTFKSPLATCLSVMPNGKGFCEGSMEGKVTVETFSGDTRYTFRCHRRTLMDDIEFAGPVNDVIFMDNNRFFTGGSNTDYSIGLWDYTNKKRIKQYKHLPMAVTKLKYKSGKLAVAMGDYFFKNSVSIEESTLPEASSQIIIIPIDDDYNGNKNSI